MPRVLVIDDDEVFVKLMMLALKQRGYEVEYALDGEAGYRAFKASDFDAVICDIVMPEKEGIETIRDIRDAAPDAKIIAISGGGRIGNTDFLKIARQLGASEVVAKPLDPDHFLEIVRSCLAAA